MTERPEETETELDVGSEPISPASAMAIGMHKGRKRPAPDPKFEAFLDKQSRLIDLQTEHLHEQRSLILSRLRWGRYSDRMKALLQTLGVALGAAIVIGLGVLAWRAHADHGLLVEAFSAPPSFAQRGIGGDVVAADIVNKLSGIVAVVRSHSVSSTNGASEDAGGDFKIEIPETGVSLAEVWRAMRDWLGSERKVTGSLRESADNSITLTASLGGEVFTTTGAPTDLDQLEQQIAEKLYAASDPANIAAYFVFQGRSEDALAAASRRVTIARNREDRADAFALWAQVSGPARIQELSRIALSIDPGLLIGHANLAYADLELGRDEAALAEVRRMLTLKDVDQPAQQRGKGTAGLRAYALHTIETLTGDFAEAARDKAPPDRNPAIQVDADDPSSLLAPADADAHLHDQADAMALLTQAAAITDPGSPDLLTTRYDIDLSRDRWTAVLGDAEALNATKTSVTTWSVTNIQNRYRPMLAQAQAHIGKVADAAATIAGTPLDCYDCLRVRGKIAELSGDHAGADRWFAEAVRQGPSLPFAYLDWGQALLAKGDVAGAIAKLQLAHEKGPRYADPLEVWGEALMAKRDDASAISKFAEADKDAPKWGRNHLRWGEALMLSGRYAEARAQYQIANGLDLSVGDRAALNVLLARTATGPLHG